MSMLIQYLPVITELTENAVPVSLTVSVALTRLSLSLGFS